MLAYVIWFSLGTPLPFAQFTSSYDPLVFFLLSGGIAFLVVRAGVRQGIERLSKVLIPLLFAMLFLLLASALSLPGAERGVVFYLTPDVSKLADPLVWTAALGQAFFSLGVGTGIMLTYGSYMRDEHIVKSAAVITVADLLVAILGGFVVFPIVFSFGLDPAAGVQLAFVSLPSVFQHMLFGFVLGAMFFLLLFFAALTSAVSTLEVLAATLMDTYGVARQRAAAVAAIGVVVIGLPSPLSYTALQVKLFGVPLLDLKDLVFGTLGMIAAGLVLSVSAGWFLEVRVILSGIGLPVSLQRGKWRKG